MPLTVLTMQYLLEMYHLEKQEDDVPIFVIAFVWSVLSMVMTTVVLVRKFRSIHTRFNDRVLPRIIVTVILHATYIFHLSFG